ncbi:MAG TPA: filamentous hemagglutinin N-terminal domain-containing protein, partial [Rhizomicrobium sp.]|nr:filamentous hemagglutinin N-terminal domain-containing protein [Rhizomicrobium sp.]
MRTYLLTTVAVGAMASFGMIGGARANPNGYAIPSAVTSPPTITGSNPTGSTTAASGNVTINLNQNRTIINWDSYNIGSGETTSYIFGAGHNSWIVLNKVNAGSATINGTLQGCLADCTTFGGNIWIYARDGVLIGNGAVVNAGGFLATTSPLSTSDSDFVNPATNTFAFGAANPGTSVSVQGNAQITAAGGTIAFIAPQVSTDAGTTVTATGQGSSVLFGAATSYTLQFAPDAAG